MEGHIYNFVMKEGIIDPLNKPKQSYPFTYRNGMSRKRSQMHIANSNSLGDFMTLKKASSCSTIYIDDSTVSQPNLKNTIKCVSLAIYYHIKNRKSETILDIFDEKNHPLTVSKIILLFIVFL